MEKVCLICKKKYKSKSKNGKYCSRECQYESYRKLSANRIICKCLNCSIEFEVKEYDISLGRGKYCSRDCKDIHQKYKYKGENNPMYGKKNNDETKKKKSEITKKLWENIEYRKKIIKSHDEFYKKNGYRPGSDIISQERRKKTMIDKYGIPHNWVGEYGKRKCDDTTLKKYGKMSVDMLINYNIKYGKETDIEKKFRELLESLEIPHQIKFRIYTKNKKPFWFREFDFLIQDTNILIEIDGDYWHGNRNTIGDLNKFQIETQKKDKLKENFATKKGFTVVRFWGSEIKNNTNKIKEELLNIVKNYDKN